MIAEISQQTQFDKVPGLKAEWERTKPLIIEALKYDELYEIDDVECCLLYTSPSPRD